jgi:hypothetical protein
VRESEDSPPAADGTRGETGVVREEGGPHQAGAGAHHAGADGWGPDARFPKKDPHH